MLNCIQEILEGSTTATAALTKLQKGIAGYGASYKGLTVQRERVGGRPAVPGRLPAPLCKRCMDEVGVS